MQTEKPRRRLVGWMQYLMTLADKGVFYSFASAFLCGGIVLMLLAGWIIVASLINIFQGDYLGIVAGSIGVGIALVGLKVIRIAKNWIKEARQIAPVALLTKSNVKQLPEVETLVRGSDRPLTAPQDELLRAARQGQETPPEQLLRATTEDGHHA